MKIGDKIKVPVVQTIGPCNVDRCNAVVYARMNNKDHLVVVDVREDERGTIVEACGGNSKSGANSDFRLSDVELYNP